MKYDIHFEKECIGYVITTQLTYNAFDNDAFLYIKLVTLEK